MTTTRELWENTLTDLELTLPKPTFTTWFRDTHIARFEDGVIYLVVPNQFVRDWLATKYHKMILESLRSLSDSIRSIEYVISRSSKRPVEEVLQASSSELPLESVHSTTNLNPRYTFDSFIVGSFNELAHAASQAII